MPPGDEMTVVTDFHLKKQEQMRRGLGKSNPLPLRITQSGGNVRPRESSPLSGVGGVSVWDQANKSAP